MSDQDKVSVDDMMNEIMEELVGDHEEEEEKCKHNQDHYYEEKITHADIEDSYEPEDNYDDLDEIEKEAEQLKITKEFQEMVVKFVKMDDLIRKKEKEVKELKTQRKPCEAFILEYLDKIGETVIEITGGKLRKNKSETKTPLTQEVIKDAIMEKIKDPLEVEQIISLMDTLRPKTERVNLKRTALKGKRVKKNNIEDTSDNE